MTKERDSLIKQKSSDETSIADLSAEIEDLKKQASSLTESYKSAKSEHNNAVAENDEINSKIHDIEGQISALETQKADMEQEVSKLSSQKDAKLAELNELKSFIDTKKKELENKEQNIEAIKTLQEFFKQEGSDDALGILNGTNGWAQTIGTPNRTARVKYIDQLDMYGKKYADYTNGEDVDDATRLNNVMIALDAIEESNKLREKHGLKPLLVSDELMAIAAVQANWEVEFQKQQQQYINDHNLSSSPTIDHASNYYETKYQKWTGENLAAGQSDVPEAFGDWYWAEKALNDGVDKYTDDYGVDHYSKYAGTVGHYENVVNKSYKTTGAGFNSKKSTNTNGVYFNNVWTQEFAFDSIPDWRDGYSVTSNRVTLKTYTTEEYRERIKKAIEKSLSVNQSNEILALRDEITKAEGSLSTIQTEYDSTLSSYNAKNEELNDVIQRINAKNSEKDGLSSSLKDVAALKKTMDGFKELLDSVNDDLEDKTAQFNSLNAGLAKYSVIDEKNQQIESLKNDVQAKSKRIDDIDDEVSTLESRYSDIIKLANDYQEKLSERDTINKEIGEKTANIANLNTSKEKIADQIGEITGEINQLNDGITKLETSISDINTDIDNLNKKVSDTDKKVSTYSSKLEDAKNDLDELTGKLTNLGKSRDSSNAELDTLNEKINALQKLLEEKSVLEEQAKFVLANNDLTEIVMYGHNGVVTLDDMIDPQLEEDFTKAHQAYLDAKKAYEDLLAKEPENEAALKDAEDKLANAAADLADFAVEYNAVLVAYNKLPSRPVESEQANSSKYSADVQGINSQAKSGVIPKTGDMTSSAPALLASLGIASIIVSKIAKKRED